MADEVSEPQRRKLLRTPPEDGVYAEWRGLVLPANHLGGSPPCVRLIWNRPEAPDDSFEQRAGIDFRVTPEAELTQLFHLRTYCTWKGERCLVNGVAPNGRIGLYWIPTGKTFDPTPLGFGPTWERGQYSAAAPAEELEDVHQERSDIPLPHLQHGTEQD